MADLHLAVFGHERTLADDGLAVVLNYFSNAETAEALEQKF